MSEQNDILSIKNFFEPPLTIKLYNKYVECSAIKDNAKLTKVMKYDDFKKLFVEKTIETPTFPLWTLKYKVSEDKMNIIVGDKIDEFTIKYHPNFKDYHDITLHIPYMFLYLKYTKSSDKFYLEESKVLGSFLRPNANLNNLKVLSLANTYPDSRRICWGEATRDESAFVIKNNDLSSIYNLWYLWHNMYSNDDLVTYPEILPNHGRKFLFDTEFNSASFVKQTFKFD